MSNQQFGVVQLKIMQVLWDRGQANAREITSALNKEQEIAHSTVQTLLRQLELKGAISHQRENRTFVFRPMIEQDSVVASEIRQLKKRLFSGSAMSLVSYLLKQETIAPEEMNEIKRLIQEKELSS